MRELGQPAPPQTLNVPGKVWLLQKWPVPLVFTEVTPINSGGTYHHHVHTCFNLAGHHYHFDHFYLGLYGAGRGQAIVSLFEDGQLVGKALKGGTALGFGWNYGWPLKVYCKAGLLRYNYDVGHFDPERNSDASQPAFAWYTEKHAL
ncbi:hypothetical protein SAMN05444008_101356 [Cnuella takakiae]|uniref:Uncharacterized protein n=2 Tax=Cnuella takakiae TaxID=1302690 RepID=A0A1M4T8F7_9BACT|nr:hypothetical protein BUE76_01350 [Cnuella takakiae]SHE40793.1 hypothetical protein SAMN05444008_101356 [Cnuella takakiae]